MKAYYTAICLLSTSRIDSPSRCVTPSRSINQNGDKDWESGSNGTSPAPEYTGTSLNSADLHAMLLGLLAPHRIQLLYNQPVSLVYINYFSSAGTIRSFCIY